MWSSLRVELSRQTPLRSYWQRRVPAIPVATRAGNASFFFWPGLNVGVRQLNPTALIFVNRHFVHPRPVRNRLLWRSLLRAAQIAGPRAVPAELTGDLQGDVVFLGSSVIEFDFSRQRCTKHYRVLNSPYLARCQELVEIVAPEMRVETGGDSLRMSAPLWSGHPVPTTANANERWKLYGQAFERLAKMQSLRSSTRPLGEYAQELYESAPSCFQRHHYARALLKALQKHRADVRLAATHGDFKDQNLLCTADGVRIIDWELADIRSASHDLFNLLIHEALHHRRSGNKIVKSLGGRLLWEQLETHCRRLQGEKSSVETQRNLLRLALLEKGLLLMSGRWTEFEEQCLRDWEQAIPRLNEVCELGIAA